MLNHIRAFLRDEDGAVTVESVVTLGGSAIMGYALILDISAGVMALADRTGDYLGSDAFYERLLDAGSGGLASDGPAAPSAPGSSPGGDAATSAGGDGGAGSGGDGGSGASSSAGNPGNDKNVGNAGERPNRKGGWGSGSRGRSR